MKIPRVLAAVFFGTAVSSLFPAGSGEPILRPFALMGNPPPVQMIVPGFVVRELPVQLTNVNNLAYGPDGKLYAYAYDGNVYRLEDTDGDGLEDKASHFFQNENEEIVGSVGMAWGPDKNLYLASRQRVVRLRDKGDGTAALETFASGWEAPDNPGTRYLDVYGVAFDRAGNFYFGSIRPRRRRNTPAPGIAARSRRSRPTVNAKSSPPASVSRFRSASTPPTICSPPTRKGRRGSSTAIPSTSCCTSSARGTTGFLPAIRSTCPG